jgi:hypothetical protein
LRGNAPVAEDENYEGKTRGDEEGTNIVDSFVGLY